MKDDNRLPVLVCPVCKDKLRLTSPNSYSCKGCGGTYPIINGIPHLIKKRLENLKVQQMRGYDEYPIVLKPTYFVLDKHGFSYGIRLKEIKLKQMLSSFGFSEGDLVLDVGCGRGRLLNKLNAQYKTKGVGIDISSVQIEKNIENNPFANIYYVADAERLPFADGSFNYVTCLDVLEHLPSPEKCIAEISRVLKAKGNALIFTLSRNNGYTWHQCLKMVTFGKLGFDRGRRDDHNRENFVHPGELFKSCQDNKLKVRKLIYFHSFFTLAFDEIYEYFLSFIYRFKLPKGTKAKEEKAQAELGKDNLKDLKVSALVKICSTVNSFILPLLESLDWLWYRKGYSNGFFITAEKT